MNPFTVELLNAAEKHGRAKQVRAYQLLNRANATQSSRAGLLAQVGTCLGAMLVRVGQRLIVHHLKLTDQCQVGDNVLSDLT